MESFFFVYGRPIWTVVALLLALVIGLGVSGLMASQHRKRFLVAASVVIALGGAAFLWAATHWVPPTCADEITEANTLAYLRQKLLLLGYSGADASTFRVTDYAKQTEQAWPTYAFYFTGTKTGKVQGIIAIGNGCGFDEIQESEPVTITKVD